MPNFGTGSNSARDRKYHTCYEGGYWILRFFGGAIGLLLKIYHFECDSRLCDWLLGAVPTARVESIHYVVTKTICARPRRGGMQAKAVYVVYIYTFFSRNTLLPHPVSLRKSVCWGVLDFLFFSFLKIETIFHNSPQSPPGQYQDNTWNETTADNFLPPSCPAHHSLISFH